MNWTIDFRRNTSFTVFPKKLEDKVSKDWLEVQSWLKECLSELSNEILGTGITSRLQNYKQIFYKFHNFHNAANHSKDLNQSLLDATIIQFACPNSFS